MNRWANASLRPANQPTTRHIAVDMTTSNGIRHNVEAVPQLSGVPSALRWVGIQSARRLMRAASVATIITRLTAPTPSAPSTNRRVASALARAPEMPSWLALRADGAWPTRRRATNDPDRRLGSARQSARAAALGAGHSASGRSASSSWVGGLTRRRARTGRSAGADWAGGRDASRLPAESSGPHPAREPNASPNVGMGVLPRTPTRGGVEVSSWLGWRRPGRDLEEDPSDHEGRSTSSTYGSGPGRPLSGEADNGVRAISDSSRYWS